MLTTFGLFSFCFCSLCLKDVISADQCAGKPLVVNGITSSSNVQILNSVKSLYEAERKDSGRKVTLNIQQVSSLKGELAVTVFGTKPLLGFLSNNSHGTNNVFKFPIVASALVIICNLPEFNNISLAIPMVVYIYTGRQKYWNNTYIAKLNPDINLPYQLIKPIARYDTDDSTTLLTQVLSASNKEWHDKYGVISDPKFVNGTSTKWPEDVIYMYANMMVGMVGLVASVPYSIGYALLPALSQYNIDQATLTTKLDNGTIKKPTVESVQAAMTYFMNNSGSDDLLLNLNTENDSTSYPLSAFTYAMVNKTYSDVDCCLVEEAVGFLDWFLFDWSTEEMAKLDFVPLIPELKLRVKRLVLEQVTCDGVLVYKNYLASKNKDGTVNGSGWQTAIISISVCLAVIVTVCLLFYKYIRNQSDEKRWIVDSKCIKLISEPTKINQAANSIEVLSVCSVVDNSGVGTMGPPPTNYSNRGVQDQMIIAKLNGVDKVYLDKLDCRYPQNWNTAIKRLMNKMKISINKNVTALMGVTVLNHEPYLIYDYSSKGTLHYILQTTHYNITDEIKYQFAIDISNGMNFLHRFGIVHGQLSSITCYLDSTWTVKIAKWKQMTIYQTENQKKISDFASYNPENLLSDEEFIKLVYIDPDIRQSFDKNVDLYSFGLLLIEIFTQKLPYASEFENGPSSYVEVLMKKFHQNILPPSNVHDVPQKIIDMSDVCISKEYHRPSFQKLYSELRGMTKISTGIIDIVMNSLEQHAVKLEEKVEERTAELKQVTDRMRMLLNEVLPPQIAEKLFKGQPVPPEYFECVTIYFSDIVGFTVLSARSTPIQVMTLLNDLWMTFDVEIGKFDVYKVDTIGDAYMVCSGLPLRNGVDHCKQIAFLALALREKCSRFKISHMPKEVLKIRIGINSGPVTAGVVGFKMPQYCIFGDTVNTASRMESTSIENKIQISCFTRELITKNFPDQFKMEHRGELSVKGKGNMETYWLLARNDMIENRI